MAYQPTTNFGWAMPRGGDQAQISVINQQFTAKADEIVYQTRRMIAPGYIDDGSKTYHEGDIVEYENVDYVCSGTTSGAWDSSKWDSTDMATQIQEAKESGGTNVEANPVEAATADLHKLKVDTTVYGIPDPTVTKTATGNPIEITDGASAPLVKCVTQITGSQDLHGYDKPWVGGAGVNKCDEEWEIGGFNVGTGIPYAATDRIRSKNFIPVLASTTYYLCMPEGIQGLVVCYDSSYNIIDTNPQYGTSRTFSTPSDCAFIKIGLGGAYGTTYHDDIAFNYPSTVTTYYPYSNICPITAYDEGEIEVRGKNLFNKNGTLNTGYLQEDGSISGNGGYRYTDYISIISNEQYYFYLMQGTNPAICWYDEHKNFISGIKNNGAQILTLHAPANAKYVRASILKENVNTFTIKKVDGDTTSTPYVGTTHETTYPSAIYRGSEDCVNGTVGANSDGEEWIKVTFDGSNDENWGIGYWGGGARFLIATSPTATDTPTDIIASWLHTVNAQEDYAIRLGTGGKIDIYVPTSIASTVSDLRTYLSTHNLEVAYKLASPTEEIISVSNLPIRTISGYSHIESSTGDMEVEYITQTYQPLVDLNDDVAEHREVYSTDEQEIGTWVDGSKLYQKTYTFSGTGAANPYRTTVDMTGKTVTNVIPHYAKYTYNGGTVGYCVGSRLTANNSNVLTIQYNDEAPPTLDVIANLGGSTETYEVCFTLQYIKTSSNNRSLSKGATEGLKADLSEEKKEIEESVDKVDKVDEPTETIEEKEGNAGESNSENER